MDGTQQQQQQGGVGQSGNSVDTAGYTFQLEDAEGGIHEYHVGKKHPPISRSKGPSGLRLLNYVAQVAGEPIAEFVQTNAGQIMQSYVDNAQQGGGMPDQGALLDAVDSDDPDDFDLELVEALNRLTTAFEHVDPDSIFSKLFFWTERDGKALRKDVNFNAAYSGNYMELMYAAIKVCRYNGFFGSLGGRIASMTEDEE